MEILNQNPEIKVSYSTKCESGKYGSICLWELTLILWRQKSKRNIFPRIKKNEPHFLSVWHRSMLILKKDVLKKILFDELNQRTTTTSAIVVVVKIFYLY